MSDIDSSVTLTLVAQPLSAQAFAPYGEVIEAQGSAQGMNQGFGRRYNDLAEVQVDAEGGRPAISIVACVAEQFPVRLRLMERHPLGSQAFIPLDGQRFLVVVAPAGNPPAPEDLQAFVTDGRQGVNYGRGTWHHPLVALERNCHFAEFHRAGPGKNCDEAPLSRPVVVQPTVHR